MEMCLTSNMRTGSIHEIKSHPVIEFHKRGVPFVICTDSPFVHESTISDEYVKLLNIINDIKLINSMESMQKKYSFLNGGK